MIALLLLLVVVVVEFSWLPPYDFSCASGSRAGRPTLTAASAVAELEDEIPCYLGGSLHYINSIAATEPYSNY